MLNTLIYEPYKDMYNYYNLITKINQNYRLYFNKKLKRFEILNIANNYEICLKFNDFSSKILDILQKTQTKNSYYIFKSIEEYNEKLETKFAKNIANNASVRLEDFLNYSKRTNKILQSDFKKIIEV